MPYEEANTVIASFLHRNFGSAIRREGRPEGGQCAGILESNWDHHRLSYGHERRERGGLTGLPARRKGCMMESCGIVQKSEIRIRSEHVYWGTGTPSTSTARPDLNRVHSTEYKVQQVLRGKILILGTLFPIVNWI